jgi:hypothetical protein
VQQPKKLADRSNRRAVERQAIVPLFIADNER